MNWKSWAVVLYQQKSLEDECLPHIDVYCIFLVENLEKLLWRSFCFSILPPKVWWVFLYTKLCSFLPVDPVHPVVSLGRWRSLIEKFQDCQLISSKKIVGRLGCWPPIGRRSTIGNDLLWTWRTWYQYFLNENFIHVKLKRFLRPWVISLVRKQAWCHHEDF